MHAQAEQDAVFHVPVWGKIAFPIVAMILGTLAFRIDLAVTTYSFQKLQHPFLVELAQNTEPFGHGIGVACILITLVLCRPGTLVTYLRVAAICLVAGLTTDAVKLSYGRVRPRSLDWETVTHVSQTFQGWFPILNGLSPEKSFPSGHTTVAFAFAVCLSTLHPRARWMFFTLAVLVAWGRIETGAHYLSDVCFGAAIGWSVAFLLLHIYRRVDQARLKKKSAPLSHSGTLTSREEKTPIDSDSTLLEFQFSHQKAA